MRRMEEKIVVYNGNLQYAIELEAEVRGDRPTYLLIRNGEVYFDNSWFSGASSYIGSEESHSLAKEIFMNQLQCAVKKRIGELKLLESVLSNIGIQDLLGNSFTESQKLLISRQVEDEVQKQVIARVKPKALVKEKPNKKPSKKVDEDDEEENLN